MKNGEWKAEHVEGIMILKVDKYNSMLARTVFKGALGSLKFRKELKKSKSILVQLQPRNKAFQIDLLTANSHICFTNPFIFGMFSHVKRTKHR